MTGSLADALRHIYRGLAFYRRDAHSEQAFQYGGHDPGVCGYTTAALIRSAMGYLDHANLEMETGLRLARELDHMPTVVHSLWSAADLHQVRREPQKVEEFAEVLLPLLSQHGSAVSLANAAGLGQGYGRAVPRGHQTSQRRIGCMASDRIKISSHLSLGTGGGGVFIRGCKRRRTKTD